MGKYKIIYGTDAMGSYCDLYKRFFFCYFPIAGVNSTGHKKGYEYAMKWQSQYNIPQTKVIEKNT